MYNMYNSKLLIDIQLELIWTSNGEIGILDFHFLNQRSFSDVDAAFAVV